MTVGDLIQALSKFPADQEICMTSRIQHGTHITAINWVGEDKHGNLVVTFDDNLLKEEIMLEKDLDALIDKAPAAKVRQCLKYIVSEWFVEEEYPVEAGAERVRTVNFDKQLNSDTLEAVTSTLHTFGFCPSVKEGRTKFHKPNPD